MRVLLVEDDKELSAAIVAAASGWAIELVSDRGTTTRTVSTVVPALTLADGLAQLRGLPFDLVVTDVALGEESGLTLVDAATKLEPVPMIVAISGQATAAQAFALAEHGVRGFLAKPFDLKELRATIQAVLSRPPNVELPAMGQVGFRHIHAVQDEVKRAMLKRALQLESGNISHAARRLGITRAAVQQMIDRFELPRSKRETKSD